ncbi:tryptophan synthase alpha chain [Microbacterium nanhaiense]|uniref:Tryptophan synthase alpha chain n=1 Tax=Microbacterium nanhaiense TaxID=1301026 RepID=A0ABQ2MYH0_9MICO|nr:tryptophan synthase subunit alpha [Microbacterium nanhaiense]GGO61868.1 tryptophan synthase alpha chain [Microbacterium nanhaiense]
MTSRVELALDGAKAAGRAAFVGYLPAGYPDPETAVEAAVALAEAGADVIELGPPYSDPVMDGPIIQETTNQVLESGFRTRDLFPLIEKITARTEVPVLVMSYWNLILQYGVERYAAALAAAGGAGIITPDITPDAAEEWIRAADEHELDRIFLAAPTSTDERLRMIAERSSGFVYTVSTMGITGERADLDEAARTLVARLRDAGATRACVGIGVTTAEHVANIAEYADGAIVGTALVKALRDGGVDGLAAKARELVAGTRREHAAHTAH